MQESVVRQKLTIDDDVRLTLLLLPVRLAGSLLGGVDFCVTDNAALEKLITRCAATQL